MKHPGHTYGGFVPAISERGMTSARLPRPSTPPEMALLPHPLPSPSISPSPISSPTRNGAINNHRLSSPAGRCSSFPDPSLRRPGLYKAPRGSPNHATLLRSSSPSLGLSSAPPPPSSSHHLSSPPPTSLLQRAAHSHPR
jgi:hypothetical protein